MVEIQEQCAMAKENGLDLASLVVLVSLMADLPWLIEKKTQFNLVI